MLGQLFTTPHEVDMAILTLLAAIIAVAIGKGGGKLLIEFLKKVVGHGDVNVNLGGGDMVNKSKGDPGRIVLDPKLCPAHEAEHERSMRNEKRGEELAADLKTTRTLIFSKLESIEGVLTEIRVAVAQLCVESKYQQGLREPRLKGGR